MSRGLSAQKALLGALSGPAEGAVERQNLLLGRVGDERVGDKGQMINSVLSELESAWALVPGPTLQCAV